MRDPNKNSARDSLVRRPRIASMHGAQLDLSAAVFPLGWNAALQRAALPAVRSWEPPPPRADVLSLKARPQLPSVRSFRFANSAPTLAELVVARRPLADDSPRAATPLPDWRQAARIRPPQDVVKVEDRLYFLLQPPLETMTAVDHVHFPLPPFPYQYKGVAFLYPRHAAVLADEMGLGKTMQAITSIRLLLMAGEIRNALLICPKPLVNNWRREFDQWAPEAPLCVIEGNQTRRAWCWSQAAAPIKIANYELLVRDLACLQDAAPRFDLVVLDEAQRIKNHHSATSAAVRSLRRTRSWALTGTPVENSPQDLVGIFEFVSPGLLQGEMNARDLGHAASDYILRRTKDMVLADLPPKLFRDADLTLTAEQQASYEMAEEAGVIRLADMGGELSIQHVFELVLRLKQICNFDPASGASCKAERLEADLEEVAASGQKAIVFSQWVDTLKKLGQRLASFHPLQYHGQIPSGKRDQVLAQFRRSQRHRVLLMSYGAGGVGLNLQYCGYVFLYDRWWNPAVEDQAVNRAHRIGAAGPVTITRMLTNGTIEERIDQILREKRAMFDEVLGGSLGPRNLGLSQQEIFGLFNIKPSRRKAG